MPIKTIAGSSLKYYLVAFDANGKERTDDPDGLMSRKILDALSNEPITDVFLMSHGWLGDIPAAQHQYDKWIAAMAANKADIEQIKQVRPGFRPLLIGLHWPSLPWGDEELEGSSVSFNTTEVSIVEPLVDEYAERIADTPTSRQALKTIFTAAMEDIAPATLPPEVREAYEVLNQEASLGSEGEGAAPGSDREPFDPESIFQNAESADVNFGNNISNGVLAPLRTLSFWKMKDRARQFGETGGFQFLTKMQKAASEQVRFHLMGHSFGCIVVSATIAGPQSKEKLVRPVDSVVLVQGALSLWSYCSDIPVAPGRGGYFYPLIGDRTVAGPMITTQSEYDTAVRKMYPLGAGIRQQIVFDPTELPKYGGLGTFGARGPSLDIVDMKMLPVESAYNFEPGKIYNLESSDFISDMSNGGLGGAHSDIAKPEVAHAVWSAAYGSGAVK